MFIGGEFFSLPALLREEAPTVFIGDTGGEAVSSLRSRLGLTGVLLREEAPVTEESLTVVTGGTRGSCVSLAAPRPLGAP